MAERLWTIVAILLLAAAAVLLWRNNLSTAFVIVTLGIVAWFLSYRSNLRAKLAAQEPPDMPEENDED